MATKRQQRLKAEQDALAAQQAAVSAISGGPAPIPAAPIDSPGQSQVSTSTPAPAPITQEDLYDVFGRGSGVTAPGSRADSVSSIITQVYPQFGTIIGYEYSSGKNNKNSQVRRPKIADGRGGFVYGTGEQNPEYDATSVGADDKGAVPGSGATSAEGGRSLSVDAFRNTLALLIGKEEADKPYIPELYRLASGFFKTGSTIEESMNLALREAKEKNAIPEFTQRFRPIFALEEMRRKGMRSEERRVGKECQP